MRRAAALFLLVLLLTPLALTAGAQYESLLYDMDMQRELYGLPVIITMHEARDLFSRISQCSQGEVRKFTELIVEALDSDRIHPDRVNTYLDLLADVLLDDATSGSGSLAGCDPYDIYLFSAITFGYSMVGTLFTVSEDYMVGPRTKSIYETAVYMADFLAGNAANLSSIYPASPVGEIDRYSLYEIVGRRLAAFYVPPTGVMPEDTIPLLAFTVVMTNRGDDPRVVDLALSTGSDRVRLLAALTYTGPDSCRARYTLLSGLEHPQASTIIVYVYSSVPTSDPFYWSLEGIAWYRTLMDCIGEVETLGHWWNLLSATIPGYPERESYSITSIRAGKADLSWLSLVVPEGSGDLPVIPPSTYLQGLVEGIIHNVSLYAWELGNQTLLAWNESGVDPIDLARSHYRVRLANELVGGMYRLRDASAGPQSITQLPPVEALVAAKYAAATASALARDLADDEAPESLYWALRNTFLVTLIVDPTSPVDPYALMIVYNKTGTPLPGSLEHAISAGALDQAMNMIEAASGLDPVTRETVWLSAWSSSNSLLPLPNTTTGSLIVEEYRENLIGDPVQALLLAANTTSVEEAVEILGSAVRASASLPGSDAYNPDLALVIVEALRDAFLPLYNSNATSPEGAKLVDRSFNYNWVTNPYNPTPPSVQDSTTRVRIDWNSLVRYLYEIQNTQNPQTGTISTRPAGIYPLIQEYNAKRWSDPEQASQVLEELQRLISQDPEAASIAREVGVDQLLRGSGQTPEETVSIALDPEQIANLVEKLVEQGRLKEARAVLDSLPEDTLQQVLEDLGDTASLLENLDIQDIPDLPDTGGLDVGLDAPSAPSLDAPSLDPPSLSLPEGDGGLLPLILAIILAPLALAAARMLGEISTSRPASEALRELEQAKRDVEAGHAEPGTLRERIIRAYKRLLDALGSRYRGKLPWETHREYDTRLPPELREVHRDPAGIFERAKFSSRPVSVEDLDRMIAALRRLLGGEG